MPNEYIIHPIPVGNNKDCTGCIYHNRDQTGCDLYDLYSSQAIRKDIRSGFNYVKFICGHNEIIGLVHRLTLEPVDLKELVKHAKL